MQLVRTEVRGKNEGTAPPPRPQLSVGFILADQFTLSAFSLFVDHLRLAADEGDRSRPILCRWSILSSRAEPVKSSCGAAIQRSSPLVDPRQFDYIVVVGGLLYGKTPIDEETAEYLRQAATQGVKLVGVCTGSFILCRVGLMNGRHCCVSWYHYLDFVAEFPDHHPVADRLFVVDGDRITCSGGGGSADLAGYLIERHIGRAVAQKSRHVLLLDRQRSGSDAQPHPPVSEAITDERVRRAMLMMEQHLAEPLSIAEIAERLGVSTRQLERLFQTVLNMRPAMFYRTLRLRYARWLLDNTDRLVTDIALEAGFSDCAHFSRQYKALYGTAPSKARSLGEAAPDGFEPLEPMRRQRDSQIAGSRVFG
jgi:transcriptional regulator GlxA family with amidase domain